MSLRDHSYNKMDRWSGKVALVTGASAGIGAAVAVELVKHGVKVVALARRLDRLQALENQLKSEKGKLYPLQGDVSKKESILEVFNWIRTNLGTIHILVNNAGIARPGKLLEGSPESWEAVFRVNVQGLCICTQQAFKLMKETGVDDGHIIHINSMSGHRVANMTDPNMNVYPASKHAVTALTETIRQELRFFKTNTKVTSISPGYVETEFATASLEGTGTEFSDVTKKQFASFPALQAKDIADSVVYVLSTPPHVQVHEIMIRPLGQLF